MSKRKEAPFEAQEELMEEDAAPVDPAHAVHEHRKRHVALWVATIGTFVLIAALWVMILPTQLGLGGGLGLRNAFGLSQPRAQTDTSTPQESFGDIMTTIRESLNNFAVSQQARYAQEDAVSAETARLRARIEAAGTNAAPTNAAPTNAAPAANAAPTDVNR